MLIFFFIFFPLSAVASSVILDHQQLPLCFKDREGKHYLHLFWHHDPLRERKIVGVIKPAGTGPKSEVDQVQSCIEGDQRIYLNPAQLHRLLKNPLAVEVNTTSQIIKKSQSTFDLSGNERLLENIRIPKHVEILYPQGKSNYQVAIALAFSPDDDRLWHSSPSYNINKEIKELLTYFFRERDVGVTVYYHTSAKTIHDILHQGNYQHVIWISHGVYRGKHLSSDNLQTAVITDVEGRNIAPLFQHIHPSISELSMIGCGAYPILKNFENNHYYDFNPYLSIRTTAEDGGKFWYSRKQLYKTLQKLNFTKNSKQVPFCPVVKGYSVEISKNESLPTTQLWLEAGNDFIYFLSNHPRQSFYLYSKGDGGLPKINLQSGFAPNYSFPTDFFPLLELQHFDMVWERFNRKNGEPVGVGSHLYRLNKAEKKSPIATMALPFNCEPGVPYYTLESDFLQLNYLGNKITPYRVPLKTWVVPL